MDVSGIVLAGGRSRRMGRDKRLIEVDGTPLLRRAIELMAVLTDDLVVCCRADDEPPRELLAGTPARLAFDRVGEGPLAGIAAGLGAAGHEIAVVLPVDMPHLAAPMLESLVGALRNDRDADAALFAIETGTLPLPAAYRRAALARLTTRLEAGLFQLRAWHATLQLCPVDGRSFETANPSSFANVNTAADVEPAGSGLP